MEEFKMDETDELYHHGILGQKWGVRRYQRSDGSLTKAGEKRYGTKTNFNKVQAAKNAYAKSHSKATKLKEQQNARTAKDIAKYKKKMGEEVEDKKSSSTKPKTKSMSEMSDDEIRAKINRIQLENQLKSLQPAQVSKGKAFMKSLANDVIAPVAKEVGKEYLKKVAKDALGLNENNMDKYTRASKEAKYYQDMKSIKESKEAISGKSKKLSKEEKAKKDSDYWKDMNTAAQQKEQYEKRMEAEKRQKHSSKNNKNNQQQNDNNKNNQQQNDNNKNNQQNGNNKNNQQQNNNNNKNNQQQNNNQKSQSNQTNGKQAVSRVKNADRESSDGWDVVANTPSKEVQSLFRSEGGEHKLDGWLTKNEAEYLNMIAKKKQW